MRSGTTVFVRPPTLESHEPKSHLNGRARPAIASAIIAPIAALLLLSTISCGNKSKPNGQAMAQQENAEPAVLYSDKTKEAGILFQQRDGGCGMRYFVEQVAAGAAVFDANGDGYPDIYFPAPKPLGPCKFKEPLAQRLYLNDGNGHFTLSRNAFGGSETDYGIAAAVGDFDNDGHPDLLVACFGKCTLYHNRGNGTFEDVTRKSGINAQGFCTGAVWFDYDGDGYLDLYIGRYCEWSLAKDIACEGPHGVRDVCNPQTYPASRDMLFHNNGNGTFTDVTKKAGMAQWQRRNLGIVAADFDGDGKTDLFVANDLGPNYLYHNRGDGTFEDVAAQQSVALGGSGNTQANMGVAVGDYNNSGRLSVLVTTFANEPYTLYNNDGGFFSDVSSTTGIGPATTDYLGFGTGFLDTRNLGRLDLFFANGHVSPFSQMKDKRYGYKERNQLLLNDGKGHYSDDLKALPADDVRVHRGAFFLDYDNDGKMDILTTAENDRPTLLHNETATGNWLKLSLTNKFGCTTPVGTKCTASVNGQKLFRIVLGGGSYGGDSDQRVHFGLGPADKVDSLEIKWLSGKTQVLTNVRANQILKITEEK